jgi:hypothetical protein
VIVDESARGRWPDGGRRWSAHAGLCAAIVVLVAGSARADDGGVRLDPYDAGTLRADAPLADDEPFMVPLRAHRALLARVAREGTGLPDDETLRRALGIPNLLRMTLREHGNVLRLARQTRRSARGVMNDAGITMGDAGPTALDLSTDGGQGRVVATTRTADEVVLDDALAVIRRVINAGEPSERAANEAREAERTKERERAALQLLEAEAAREAALLEVQRAHTARLETLLEHAARIAGFSADLARARSDLLESVEKTKRELVVVGNEVLAARDDARQVPEGEIRDALARALTIERALLIRIDDVRARERARVQALTGTAESILSTVKERSSSAVVEEERGSLARIEAAASHAQGELDELVLLSAREQGELHRETLALIESIDEVRLVLQEKAPARVRAELYSLSELGIENLSLSLLHLATRVRVHVEQRVYLITHPEQSRANIVELGRFVFSFGWGLLLVVLAFVLWRRIPAWWPRVRAALSRRTTTREGARAAALFLDVAEAFAPRAYLITVTLWIHSSVADALPQPETDVVVEIILWVLWYQLIARATHFAILRVTRNHITLTAVIRLAILRSVRLVLRYAFFALSSLSFLRALVGLDVLYFGVRVAFVAGTVPVAVLLLLRWRENIIADYVAHRPDSRLAHAFEEHPTGLWRTLLSFGALASVTAGGVVVFGRDFALGFEQTRKALAFLFRLRIERQAKTRGRAPFVLESLPKSLIDACVDVPLVGTTGLVSSRVESAMIEAQEAMGMRRGRSVLVDAGAGMGLSTWLLHLERAVEVQKGASRHFRPTTRITTPDALHAALFSMLDPDDATPIADAEHVVTRALELDLDLITVDGLEWLFLRELDGYRALDALFDIVRRTRHRVSWVLGASATTVEFLSQTRRIDAQVSYRRTLLPWSEDDIRMLLLDRQRRSGLNVTYDELLVHGLDIASSEVVETEEGYTRLLWNFAGGNPRLAQHFWLRSLVVKSEHEVSVRLYDAPSPDDLEVLPDGERFMLFSTLLHRSLSHDEIARTCRMPLGSVDAHVSRGLDLGFYEMNEARGLSVTTPWSLAVNRYLRRKNLV